MTRADDADRIVLTDDGTLDTVILCRRCGAEGRYNYDGEHVPRCAVTLSHDDQTPCDHRCYAAFVAWAITDFTDDHDCADAREGENNEE